MKRTALVLAAAFLGTGCIVTDHDCDFRDVFVPWSGFTGPDAVANRSCIDAGVSWVDVFLDDVPVGRFACGAYGVTILDVSRGSHTLTTEGIDSNGSTILFRDDRSFSDSGCGNISVGPVEPAAGFVDLDYLFYSGGTLLDPQVCAGDRLWLSIFDPLANVQPVLSDSGTLPAAYACGGVNAPLSFPLPTGSYLLEWMEERNGTTLKSADCTDRSFTVPAASAVSVPVNLERTAGACTRVAH